jgi:hypothetical protein
LEFRPSLASMSRSFFNSWHFTEIAMSDASSDWDNAALPLDRYSTSQPSAPSPLGSEERQYRLRPAARSAQRGSPFRGIPLEMKIQHCSELKPQIAGNWSFPAQSR